MRNSEIMLMVRVFRTGWEWVQTGALYEVEIVRELIWARFETRDTVDVPMGETFYSVTGGNTGCLMKTEETCMGDVVRRLFDASH